MKGGGIIKFVISKDFAGCSAGNGLKTSTKDQIGFNHIHLLERWLWQPELGE